MKTMNKLAALLLLCVAGPSFAFHNGDVLNCTFDNGNRFKMEVNDEGTELGTITFGDEGEDLYVGSNDYFVFYHRDNVSGNILFEDVIVVDSTSYKGTYQHGDTDVTDPISCTYKNIL